MLKNQTFSEQFFTLDSDSNIKYFQNLDKWGIIMLKIVTNRKLRVNKMFFDQILELFSAFCSKRKELCVDTTIPTNTNATYDLSIKHKIVVGGAELQCK